MTQAQYSDEQSVAEYVSALKKSRKYGPQVVCHKIFPETSAEFNNKIPHISSQLQSCLMDIGIDKLYSHQAEAFEKVVNNENIIIATPTSSGKSMVYNLPVLDRIITSQKCHALYLFPLKALSQDQLRTLEKLSSKISDLKKSDSNTVAAIYDGDTSPYQRRKIREQTPHIVITNPEMLHLSLLPHHENWAHFFRNLEFVVIDEVHTYRGVFGSHFSWLIRRLKRIAQHYGKNPLFIMSSATIGNPGKFAEKIIGEPVSAVLNSGAPQSTKNFLLFNPFDSAAYSASQLLEAAMKRGLRTIVYTQSRKMTELISMWTQPRLGALAEKLSSYRAGFLPEERREIEAKLNDGRLVGVISTSALELGIDIGDLDICILVGYPGSIMSSWQRGGRVGRAGNESAVILIGSEDALDQYYMKNPQSFFSKEVESAVVNPNNQKIIKDHLHCAAAELPLEADESLLQKDIIRSSLDQLVEKSILLQSAEGEQYYASRKRPHRYVNLRGSGDSFTIIDGDNGLIFGDIDGARALKECHEGAIYLHRIKTWLITKLDLMTKEVVAVEKSAPYYTRTLVSKDTEILDIKEQRTVFGCRLCRGELKVTEKVTAFQKRNKGTSKLINTVPLDLPEQIMETTGLWLEIPQSIVDQIEIQKHHFMGGLHALEHLMISVFPLLVLCDRNDIGGISCPHHQQTEGATIFIYDGHSGGSGLSYEAFCKAEQLISTAHHIVNTCDCENGCPACVHSPKCGSGNKPIDKLSCITLAENILNNRVNNDALILAENTQTEYVSEKKKALKIEASLYEKNSESVLPEHWCVFDLETKYSAEEVGGWHRAEKMEMSVCVVYDSKLDGYVTYLEEEAKHLIDHLMAVDLVVGFNNKRFDNRVLSAYSKISFDALPTIDLLEEIKNHLGYRLSLNAVAEHTLGIKKSGDGLRALQWYREGNWEDLIKYCRKDVELTKNLFVYGIKNGFFLFQNKAKKKVRLPLSLEKAVCRQRHNASKA